ncbi:MAG: hypothetical protein K2X82_19135, partial [Gemmataceae bacterium]|nr:hypothetical protein [Gemmataceae bacterium]
AFADRDVLAGAAGDDTTAAEGGRVYRAAPAAFVTQTAADPLAEGGTLTVSGSFTDPGLLDGHTAIIVWGNGYYTRIPLAGGTNVFSATYQYLDDDPTGTPQDDYAVRVRVADDYADVLTVDRQTIGDSITRFDGSTGAEAGTLASSLVPAPGGGTPPFSSGVAVGPDGLLYVAYSGGLRSVFRFDPTSGESLGAFATGIPAGPGGQGNNLRFGPDGNLYLRDAVGRMLRRFDGRTGAALPLGAEGTIFGPNPAPFAGPGGLTYRPSEFAFGPDGHVYLGNFYLAGGLYRWAVLKYDGTTGTFLGYALGGPEAVPPGATIPYEPVGLTFGPDGDLFILADQTPGVGVSRAAFQYDLTTGELVRVIAFSPTPGPGGAVGGDDILFTPDNALLYLDVEAGTVDRYDLATGRFIDEFIPGGLDYTAGGLLLGVSPEDVTVAAQTVRNVAPAVAVRPAPNPAGAPAGAFTLSADVADPGTRDTLVYAWAVTAGTVSSSSVSPDGRSFTYVPAGGALTIALTVTDDDTGSATAGTRVVFGTAAGETITLSNTQSKVGSAAAVGYGAGVDRIVVYGLGGDDTISAAGMTAAAGLPVVLVGGNGADSLTGGPKADLLLGNSPGDYDAGTDDHAGDTLAGGGGNDTLDGGLGNDSVAGGDDDDTYSEGPGSDDVLSEQGTTGTDTIDYGIAAFGITFGLDRDGVAQVVNPSAPAGSRHTVKALGKFENLVGSPFADDLGGDDGPNAIDGGGGNDIIFGGPKLGPTAAVLGGGRDTLVGGTGNDTVRGGAGNDVIYGGLRPAAAFALTGADPGLPDGVADDDEIEGGGGDNFIDGGGGNDRIFGGVKTGAPAPGNSTLVGGKGNDTVRGGAGNDVIYGGLRPAEGLSSAAEFTAADDDEIEGLGGDDFIDGGAGSDRI